MSLKKAYRVWISDPLIVSLNPGITNPVLGPGIWGIYPVALMAPSWHSFLAPWLSLCDNTVGPGSCLLGPAATIQIKSARVRPLGLPISIFSLRDRPLTQLKMISQCMGELSFYTNRCNHIHKCY